MTVGPWRPISLHVYQTRITDFRVASVVDENLAVDVDVSISLSSDAGATAVVSLHKPSGYVLYDSKVTLSNGEGQIKFHLNKSEVELWYPVGHGKQPLYQVEIRVYDKVRRIIILTTEMIVTLFYQQSNLLDSRTDKIGFRRAIIVEDKLDDEDGLTFLFEINNVRTFCGGRFMN